MRFLVEESCDFAVVRALRSLGYDVTAVSEVRPGSDDRNLIALAAQERRILLTEHKDFGRLVFASHEQSPGVIFIRYPGNARGNLPRAVARLLQEHADTLADSFLVLQTGHVRINRRTSS